MSNYFNTTLGISMLGDGIFSVRTLSADDAAKWLRQDDIVNAANPTHSNSLDAISRKIGVNVREAKGGRVALSAGDECLVAQISGIPRETREFSDAEICAARFEFRLVVAQARNCYVAIYPEGSM